MIPIVTATDERYLPGVRALYNSYKRHSAEGFSFHVMSYGDQALKVALEEMGLNVIHNHMIDAVFPKSERKYGHYRNDIESSAMYARLAVPDLFKEYRHSIFIDADSVILKNLQGLIEDFDEHPCAGTENWSSMSHDIVGYKVDMLSIQAAMIVFNHEWWFKKDIYNKCLDIMRTSTYTFDTVVQGVLQLVLKKDYYKYPFFHQVQGGHKTTPAKIEEAYLLHFAGTNPWEEFPAHLLPVADYKLWTRKLWASYLNE